MLRYSSYLKRVSILKNSQEILFSELPKSFLERILAVEDQRPDEIRDYWLNSIKRPFNKKVFELYLDGRISQEIGKILGKSESLVRESIEDTKEKLRKIT